MTNIKEAIKNKIKLDASRQRLIFQGKLMRDDDDVADFKVSSRNLGEGWVKVIQLMFILTCRSKTTR